MMDEEFPAHKLTYELYGPEAPLPEEDEAGNNDENEDLAARLGAIVANISEKGNEQGITIPYCLLWRREMRDCDEYRNNPAFLRY